MIVLIFHFIDLYTVDNDPPQFDGGTCPSSSSQVADAGSMTKTVSWTDPSATDSSGVPPTVTCTPQSGYAFMIGSDDVTCTAIDAAGNTALTDCSFTVTVTGMPSYWYFGSSSHLLINKPSLPHHHHHHHHHHHCHCHYHHLLPHPFVVIVAAIIYATIFNGIIVIFV